MTTAIVVEIAFAAFFLPAYFLLVGTDLAPFLLPITSYS